MDRLYLDMCCFKRPFNGFAPLDALHVAYAEAAGARILLTCDDALGILGRRYAGVLRTVIANPRDLEQELAK